MKTLLVAIAVLALIAAVIGAKVWQYDQCRTVDRLSAGTCMGVISR